MWEPLARPKKPAILKEEIIGGEANQAPTRAESEKSIITWLVKAIWSRSVLPMIVGLAGKIWIFEHFWLDKTKCADVDLHLRNMPFYIQSLPFTSAFFFPLAFWLVHLSTPLDAFFRCFFYNLSRIFFCFCMCWVNQARFDWSVLIIVVSSSPLSFSKKKREEKRR